MAQKLLKQVIESMKLSIGGKVVGGSAGVVLLLVGVGAVAKNQMGLLIDSTVTIQSLLVMITLLSLTLLVVGGVWIRRTLSDQMREFTKAHEMVAEGDFSVQVQLRSGDALEPLSRSFNHMVDQLEHAIRRKDIEAQQLEKANAALSETLADYEERLAEGLRDLAKELAAKNKELEDFVYIVSHDLKAPLVTLQGMATLLLEGYGEQLDEQARHYLNRLRVNAEQMHHFIMDLLTLARVGREGRAPEAVALDEVVDKILEEWAEPIRNKGIKVTRHDLPALWGMRVQIEQLMGNLLSNAIKYLGETNPEPTVEIGAYAREAEWECFIRDNGIGIDPAYHAKIFEIFHRLKEVEVEGTGAGLAIVKKIVEVAGGRIWVDSTQGQGATFRFTWPKAPNRENDGQA